LGVVRVGDVEVGSDEVKASEFGQDDVRAFVQNGSGYLVAVFVVGMDVVPAWVSARFVPMESDEQHRDTSPKSFNLRF